MGKRVFSAEFKREAVRQVVEDQRPRTHVARDLGIHVNVLKRWLDLAELGGDGEVGKMQAERAEIERLKKELVRVKAERDILKKAVAYFAKDTT